MQHTVHHVLSLKDMQAGEIAELLAEAERTLLDVELADVILPDAKLALFGGADDLLHMPTRSDLIAVRMAVLKYCFGLSHVA